MLPKICTIKFLDSNLEVRDRSQLHGFTREGQSMRNAFSKSADLMLKAVEEMHHAPKLHKDVSKKLVSQQLNALCMLAGLRGMLEGNDQTSLGMVSLLVASFLDRDTGM